MTVTSPTATGRWTPRQIAVWAAVAVLGAVAWGVLALARGESINAAWLIVAALCSYAIAYRFYARFIAHRVLGVDDRRATPAERLDNDVDFQPTDRRVLYGHHFAAIAGAGPLVGPARARPGRGAGRAVPPLGPVRAVPDRRGPGAAGRDPADRAAGAATGRRRPRRLGG
jgi:Carbon starvation protein CstA